MERVFSPMGSSMRLTASVTSHVTAMPTGGNVVRVLNDASVIAYVRLGASDVTAGNSAVPVSPSGAAPLYLDRGAATHVAVSLETGTGFVLVTPGVGD